MTFLIIFENYLLLNNFENDFSHHMRENLTSQQLRELHVSRDQFTAFWEKADFSSRNFEPTSVWNENMSYPLLHNGSTFGGPFWEFESSYYDFRSIPYHCRRFNILKVYASQWRRGNWGKRTKEKEMWGRERANPREIIDEGGRRYKDSIILWSFEQMLAAGFLIFGSVMNLSFRCEGSQFTICDSASFEQ